MSKKPGNYTQHANPGPRYIAHWVCKTSRREEMIDWYTQVFDAEIVHIDKRIAFLTWDGESHRLALVNLPRWLRFLFPFSRLRRKFYGFDHLAMDFGSLEDLLGRYERLRDRGIKPVWCINHGLTTSIYYEDPEGIRIEFQVENFATPEATKLYFTTQAFAENPIGVNFEPDYLLTQMRAGVPREDLLRQGAGTPPGKKTVSNMKTINWRTL
ncbi:VOC family protein [Pseudomonas sp. MAFF 301449]|uniref:VOC family protein n=1 Tax=Pseudomonas cyclaminis TaxID=2781239 RepID=A0ABR9SPV9_9PSED|nr:VOC family protein [Pseudomonas cyclaminis]MBE8590927.1 VOC family protein [Pseudomonas cyclaminis]MBE8598635.1 VOC family protein [Pseudomonas cyclaminis]